MCRTGRSSKSLGLLNGSLTFDLEDRNVSVMLWGKNILNERYKSVISSAYNAGLPFLWGSFGPPATYGVDVTVKF